MRLFVGGIATETNGFSSVPTDMAAFEELGIRRRSTPQADPAMISLMLDAIASVADGDGVQIVEGLITAAAPAGPVEAATYGALRDELLADLDAADADAALFILHGAMIADGCDDCEGDILGRARAIMGSDRAIGIVFDPHAHLTEAMVDAADILVAFKEYPHTDTADRAAEAARLVIATARGAIRPTSAIHDCRMIGLLPTDRPAARPIIDRMVAMEAAGALSMSLIHGFPWADVADVGAKALAITDANPARAATLAAALAQQVWEGRDAWGLGAVPIDEALDRIRGDRTVLLADVADNPGGGAPGDSSFILQHILALGIGQIALGGFCMPDTARSLVDMPLGAEISFRIGGAHGAVSGPPLALRGRLRACASSVGQRGFGGSIALGAAARIELDNAIDLVLIERRQQVLGPDVFAALGIDLSAKRAIVVKSAQHFRSGFAGLVHDMVAVDTPGALTQDFAAMPYRKRSLRYWPRIADPFAEPCP
jgi:microcystin degradation protein MlrC